MTLESGKDRRTLATVDKIFDLGRDHNVVAITSGENRFMKVPWSVLIGEWSRSLDRALSTVTDYAREFQVWLPTRVDLFGSECQNEFFAWQVQDYYLSIRKRIVDALNAAGLSDDDWATLDVQATVNVAVSDGIADITRRDDLQGVDADGDADYLEASAALVREQFDYVFDDVPRTLLSDVRLLAEVPALVLAKDEPWGHDATIAFIGYGADNVFPEAQAVTFHGLVNGDVRRAWCDLQTVDVATPARVTTFAQADAIDAFLNAYDNNFLREAHRCIDTAWEDESLICLDQFEPWEAMGKAISDVNAGIHQLLDASFAELSRVQFMSPLLATIEALSRTDMAQMAESLVGVQALRAASMAQMPTVGGPIDVVVISRTHGVEWVRRKELGRTR